MILTGPEIRKQIELGNIEIDPYVPEHVNPASVDLTLGKKVLEYRDTEHDEEGYPLDSREKNLTLDYDISSFGLILLPQRLYLMHTVERVCSKKFVPIMDGKSSIARLGVCVHLTAGFGDISFDGNYTMEVTCVLPVRLYAGMRIAQMRFHVVQGEIQKYEGNYVDETARGPVPSMSWKQFQASKR